MLASIFSDLTTGFAPEIGNAPASRFAGCDSVFPTPYRVGEAAATGALYHARTGKYQEIAADVRRAGGSYSVKVSLCRTAMWIEGLGALDLVEGEAHRAERAGVISLGGIFSSEEIAGWSTISKTPWGALRHLAPVAAMSETTPNWAIPSVPLGTDPPEWRQGPDC